jgi:Na+:H+ antiporter, NhaA family
VQFSAVGTLTWLIVVSLVAGKTLGILSLGLLAGALGFPLPENMTTRDLFLVSMTAGIGLTVALFVAGAAFTDPELQGAAKMGALGSLLIAPVVFLGRMLLAQKNSNAEARR